MTLVNSSGVMGLVGSGWSPPDEFDEFRIVRSLGTGAMGQVYLAHDLLLERPVAVKFVHPAKDPAARARLIEEARAIARLQHPNVVAIYRVAEFSGHPYLVSEYVNGRPLNEVDRPMPSRKVLEIALDLTRGLAAAHRRGVLHRDVKPANAILTDEGQAKLLDFGLATMDAAGDELASTQPPAAGDEPGGAASDAAIMRQQARQAREASANVTVPRPGPGPHLVGTPMYMAPEVWRCEPATRRSDLYSLGILLYELLAGVAPHRDVPIHDLAATVQLRDVPRLADAASGIDPALAAVVDRLVKRDPNARFPSADALLVALEECAAPSPTDERPDDNPYRGLAAFESSHAALFFGRRGEIRELVGRVRAEPVVVVGGDSGTGKSSLCRAGVLPWLAQHDGWSYVELVPGRHPLDALAAALAPRTTLDEAALVALLRDNPEEVARSIRQHIVAAERSTPAHRALKPTKPRGMPPESNATSRRLVVFVDQLEELVTLSEPDEAHVVAIALAALAVRTPSVRLLATGRSDFLSRLAMLPDLGDEMARGLYFLRPLGGEHIREVIVRPAAAKGVTYESEALVDDLVAQTADAPGGLPLLQFTLAELWEARDVESRTIRADALTALGGVGGALTRHADRLLAGLRANEQDAARRVLLRLVTAQGTRTRRSKAELLTDGTERSPERAALEALVSGRVLVANDADDGAYEIAHEALLTSWPTLQDWLKHDAANHALHERVEQAAASWERMQRAPDLLWGRRQLAEAKVLDRAYLAPREAAFLALSAKAMRMRRMFSAVAIAVLVIGAVVVGLAIRAKARRELESMIAEQTRAAMTAQDQARQLADQRDVQRKRALVLFDAHRWRDGEAAWTEVQAMASREERAYREAAAHLEGIMLLEPTRAGLRSWAADLTFERLLRAERDRRRDLADEMESRLIAYDDGRHQAELGAPGHLELDIAPAGTQVWIERPGAARQLLGQSPMPGVTLTPGTLVLAFEAPGHVSARLPILLARGETLPVRVALPASEASPRDMVYVPRGRFLFGSADSTEARRQIFSTAPLHEVWTEAYFIARYEVTFAQWIEFLDELAPEARRRRSPRSNNTLSSVTLTEVGPRRWRLDLTPTTQIYTAETGERLHYKGRAKRADQDWMKFPVSAVSYEDAVAFTRWLDATHRLPGARLCDEYEWERAARGADARLLPTGDTLAPDDANIDVTYGRDPLAFGPDEVGSHPSSRSPVGAEDMAGNVWEWTRSVEIPDAPVSRGGCWYHGELSARSINRDYGEPTQRTPLIGLRLCVTPQ